MSVQQFCLRWNNHQPNFISVCSSLLHNGTLVDVTLAAEGRQLQAHKIVLSACSSYFQTLFTTNPCQHPIVILKDVQYDDLKTMVDFMYYGEVNVSQEQLPHILKTAEMLKIKGLAEMPTDPANLTKSDSKSSNDATELVGGGNNNGQLGGNGGSSAGGGNASSGGLGSSSGGGSVSDSIWGSNESQFQQQQHQQQQQQQQQQHQQHHQQLQQQQHHHQQQQQQLHTQMQNSQTQTSQQQQQQHHQQQLRRTPSPLGTGSSPATRRKRLRKSSNNGSGDRTNSEDHNTSLDAATAGGLTLSQMSQMSFSGAATNSALSGLAAHSLHTAKLLKEASNNDLETNPQDSDSLDDTHGHVHMQIKPEVDMSGVPQSIPLDISGPTTPSEHDAPNSQSAHSGLQWTVVEPNYSRFSLSSCPTNLIGNNNNQNTNTNNNNSSSNDQQQQQHRQQQESVASQQQQQQQQHLQQLQQYQHQQNSAYSPQIITVSGYTNAAAAAVAAAQNLSPPSPSDGNMVQSVYSQGPTPTQSPVGNAPGSGGGGNMSGGNLTNNANIKRKRSINPQGDENFIRALEAVRSGGIGFCKAARLYGVNNRTLWLEYKKRGYPVSRPSIKSRVVKQEPNLSPSPTPPATGTDDTNENYEHMAAAVAAAQTAALNMQIPPTSETPTPSLMCTPHHAGTTAGGTTHPTMGVMSFLDTRHMDFPASLHSMSRQRYIDAGAGSGASAGTINVNPAAAMNLQKDTKTTSSFGINIAQSPQQQHQHLEHQNPQPAQMGTKRNRVLTRQPRVKRDSDSLSNNQISPEPTGSLDFEPFASSQSLYSSAVHGLHHLTTQHHHQHHSHHLLAVPPRIERHSSEPAPSLSPNSPHLLSVPQTTPFLVKQHSDPLLPSQHTAHLASSSGGSSSLTNPFAPLHRQYSHPLTGASGTYLAASAPLQHSQHISLPDSIYETSSPPPVGSSQYIVPQTKNQQPQTSASPITNTTTNTSSTTSTKSLCLPHFTTTYMGNERSNSATVACSPPIPRVPTVHLSERSTSENSTSTAAQTQSLAATASSSISLGGGNNKFRSSKSVSAVMLTERGGNTLAASGAGSSAQSGSFEHLPTLRVRNEELQRSASSPQTNREIFTMENPRSSHCPVIRPGPALGCNFCWNTIDGHGRILRRKTKYHCPECQTNLCIVPCFQEYHERLNNEQEAATSSTTTTTTNALTRIQNSSLTSSSTNPNSYSNTNSNNNQAQESRASAQATSSCSKHYAKTEI